MNISLKGYVNLWVEPSHNEPPPGHVWQPLFQCKSRYEVFNMSRDLTKSRE